MILEIDGPDVVMRNAWITCFGGGHDPGDDGQTESGILNDGSDPKLMGCALPVRSTERATASSPFADPDKPHIPWGTEVWFWEGDDDTNRILTKLIDNGPDVQQYPDHLGDLTVAAAAIFDPSIAADRLATLFGKSLSYRIIGGAKYLPSQSHGT